MTDEEYQQALNAAWVKEHGTTPMDWKAIYNAQSVEYGRSRNENRPYNPLVVDVPYGAGRGPQYPEWLLNGLYGGSGGGISRPTSEQAKGYQQNFINSVNSGNFYWPTNIESFGPSGWWYRDDYKPNEEGFQPATIEQGSWLWQMPQQYRDFFQATTPEIQDIFSKNLYPEYQRRQDYSVMPGQTRWMR